ncbi:MAG TPA: uroporphyrinogen-III synthase [Usitatibacter sp.]|nr:uroporphyrinogen-III synthase [Usitatibacter sp.]
MSAATPLAGVGVVITRPRAAAEALAAPLARAGARVFVFPALAIEDLPPSDTLEAALARLPECSLAIFVSAHAVEKGLAAAKRHGAWPKSTRVAAIGEATAQALRNSGFDAVISPHERHDSEALLARAELQPRRVAGEDITVFRGAGGLERLKEVLEERGAKVRYAECYRRVRPKSDPQPLLAAWSRGQVHAVSVLSAETLENFVAMIGAEGCERLAASALVVPHETIAAHREARRFGRVLIAAHGAEGLTHALSQLKVAP